MACQGIGTPDGIAEVTDIPKNSRQSTQSHGTPYHLKRH
jgi:hypothetical protein